jgi:hypothetical protein
MSGLIVDGIAGRTRKSLSLWKLRLLRVLLFCLITNEAPRLLI